MDLLREEDRVIESIKELDTELDTELSAKQNSLFIQCNKNPRVILSGVFKGKVFASYGLHVHALDTGRWLMVKRRHSVEYCIFLRGTYDTSHLPLLIPKLTNKERQCVSHILKLNSSDYVSYVVGCVGVEYYDIDVNPGWNKMIQNSERIAILIENIYPKIDLWTWPKGVKETFDSNGYITALREFGEEVASNLPPPIEEPVKNPFVRKTTCYGREIHEHYWTYTVDKEFDLHELNSCSLEVSKRAWKSRDPP